MSVGDGNQSFQSQFARIIQTIRIDESQMPESAGYQSHDEMIKSLEVTLDTGFTGMPPGWHWKLVGLKMGKDGQANDLFLQLMLDKPETLVLTDCFYDVLKYVKAGREPDPDKTACDMNLLITFAKQLFKILGMVASQTTADDIGVNNIHLQICDANHLVNAKFLILNDKFFQEVQQRGNPFNAIYVDKTGTQKLESLD